jgi:modification methylase
MTGMPLDQIIQGDCVQEMQLLPEGSIDLVFADPPYNLQLRQELWRPNRTLVDGENDEWDRFASFTEYDAFTRRWLDGCRRVLKDSGTLWVIGMYHNIHRIGAILQDLDYWILGEIAWIKLNPMPNFRGVRFTNAHETLIWAQKTRGARYTFNYQAMKAINDGLQMRSDWHLPLCSGKERLRVNGEKAHTTQKPEALLRRVLLASTKPGDVVLDPFMGSGTTGAAAKQLGRHWIGIERDSGYVEIARWRIASTEPLPEEALGEQANARPRSRVAFGLLVEMGMIQPGQELIARANGSARATVLPGGKIQCNEQTGSIHQVARSLENTPCNGWEYWYYQDSSGAWRPLSCLRQEWLDGLEKI